MKSNTRHIRHLALGAAFRAEWPPEELPGYARDVEVLGYYQLWLAEDRLFAGGLTMATVALAATTRIRLGIGLLPSLARNAAVAAMEIAGLSRLFPGRLIVAFGHGVESWMRQINARPGDRIKALTETIEAFGLYCRNTVTVSENYVDLSDVTLDHPPARQPVLLIGTTGQRGLSLAADCADGVLLPQRNDTRRTEVGARSE